MKYAAHKLNTAIDVATPRTLFGNISEIKTHVTGANDMAYTPIDDSKNQETSVEPAANILTTTIYKMHKPAEPINIKGLRPSLSTSNMAISVKTKFTIPIKTVCNN